MTTCEAYWNKVEQFVRVGDFDGFRSWCNTNLPTCYQKDTKRTLKEDWKIAKLRMEHPIGEKSPSAKAIYRPLILKKNANIRDKAISSLESLSKKKGVKITGKVVKKIIKDIHKEEWLQNLENNGYESEEVDNFLADKPRLFSAVSYPERGSFGRSDFRGNTSGYLLVELFNHFRPNKVFDPMEGSGTTKEVCSVMDIDYEGGDLLNGYNLLDKNTEVPINDFTFFHPPYWDIIKYSDNPKDLSNCSSWQNFEDCLIECVERLLPKTKILAVLIADIFMGSDRQFHSPLPAILHFYAHKLLRILVKVQDHYSKGFRPSYSEVPHTIPILHEYVILLKGDLTG